MTESSTKSLSPAASKFIRRSLVALGVLLIAYAASDHPLYGGEPGFGTFQAIIAAVGLAIACAAFLPSTAALGMLFVATMTIAGVLVTEFLGESLLAPRYRPIFQMDDQLIFKFIPGRTSEMTRSTVNGGETVRHSINSFGYRGKEFALAASAPRILVYGDSFIHAYYTRDSETFVEQLAAQMLDKSGNAVQVLNAGVSSYGPDQVSLKMERELPALKPQVVIAAIFAGNDYGDLVRNKIFSLDRNGSLVPNKWQLDPKVRTWFELGQRESILKRAVRDRISNLNARKGLANDPTDMSFLLSEANREYRSLVVEGNNTVTNTHIDYYSAAVSLEPDGDAAKHEIRLMGAVLKRIRDVVAKENAQLVFLFIPHPFDVAGNYDNWRVDRSQFPHYAPRNQTEPLERIAESLKVPYVSLFDVFKDKDPNALYFHGGDDHWNAKGQLQAAKAMADFLIARKLAAATNR